VVSGTLEGRRVLVTGAAQGNGEAIARAAAQAGAEVLLTDLRVEQVAATAERLRGKGLAAEAAALDVADPQAVAAVVGGAVPLHGLVCNAGISGRMPLEGITPERFDRVIAVNLRGALLCCQAALPALHAARGAIVGICSLAAHQGIPEISAYAATKGGMLAAFRTLAVELAPDVRVNTISPGVVPTGLNARRLADPEQVRRSSERVPLGRLGAPQDVAAATVFLLSEQAGWISGADLRVDGGESAA
jgi:NAD(P)-dependent dehydrogenase (short-subunit alcohol dehydrogenase family)